MFTRISTFARNKRGRMNDLIPIGCLILAAIIIAWQWPRTRGDTPPPTAPPGQGVVLRLTDQDVVTLDQAYQGMFIGGATGSGKTSAPAAQAQENLLAPGGCNAGALWLCAKFEEADRAEAIARKLGRGQDVIRITPHGPWKIDLLETALSQPGGPENAAAMMNAVVDVGNRKQSRGDEQFFKQGGERIVRRALPVLQASGKTVSILNLFRYISSTPESSAQLTAGTPEHEAWAKTSFCAECIAALDWDAIPLDAQMGVEYFTGEFASLSDKTRSSLVATVTNALDRFMSGEVMDVIASGKSNLHPRDLEEGKIIIVDFPQLRYQETGQFIAVALKALCLRSLLARDVRQSPRPVLICQDEAQLFCLPSLDSMAQGVSRSQKIINLVITQNLPMLQTALSGEHAKAEVMGWLANFQTAILCQNNCPDTNAWASKLLGTHKELMLHTNGPKQPFDPVSQFLGLGLSGASASMNEQIQPQLQPDAFTLLRKGGAPDFQVEAIVYQGGRRFSNGRTWVKAVFQQRI